MQGGWSLFLKLLVFRSANSLVIRTFFNPDEYWQSTEVAHRLVFGYGHLTWEWAAGIRGYTHVLPFAAVFQVLKDAGIDSQLAVLVAPKLLQALCAALADLYIVRLAEAQYGVGAARWALACQLCSWFNAFCLVRTFSNSAEAALTSAAMYHWAVAVSSQLPPTPQQQQHKHLQRQQQQQNGDLEQREKQQQQQQQQQQRYHQGPLGDTNAPQPLSSWDKGGGTGGRGPPPATAPNRAAASGSVLDAREGGCHMRLWLLLAALSVVVRPPCAAFWLPLGCYELLVGRMSRRILALQAAAIGSSVFAASLCIDRAMYGRWVVVPWEFLRFNLVQGGSAAYGSHPWHWNFTSGLPTVAATMLPLVLLGALAAVRSERPALPLLALWQLVVYSLPAHKEFRFLLPALQLLMPSAGLAMAQAAGEVAGDRLGDCQLHALGREQDAATAAAAAEVVGAPTRGVSAAAPVSACPDGAPSHAAAAMGGGLRLRRAAVEGSHAVDGNPVEGNPAVGSGSDQSLTATEVGGAEEAAARRGARAGGAARGLGGGEAVVAAGGRHQPPALGHLWRSRRGVAALAALAAQIPIAAYLCCVHQSGTVAVTAHLARAAALDPSLRMSAAFLAPCHSSPWYSHLHSPVDLQFLDCSPPAWKQAVEALNGGSTALGRAADEACREQQQQQAAAVNLHSANSAESAQPGSGGGTSTPTSSVAPPNQVQCFHRDPRGLLTRLLSGRQGPPPSHVVMFGYLVPKLERALREAGYGEEARFFHSHFAVDEVEAGDVVLWRRRQTDPPPTSADAAMGSAL